MCIIGMSSSLLVQLGWFPSSPIKPRTVFSLRLLWILHEMSVRGKMSRFAWAAGLRAALGKEYIKDIPPFDKLLRNAYHHWVAVDNAVQSSVMAEVDVWALETVGQHNWQVERPENLCPGCFFMTEDPADTERVVILAMDGCM